MLATFARISGLSLNPLAASTPPKEPTAAEQQHQHDDDQQRLRSHDVSPNSRCAIPVGQLYVSRSSRAPASRVPSNLNRIEGTTILFAEQFIDMQRES
jgi:hypothetical protein